MSSAVHPLETLRHLVCEAGQVLSEGEREMDQVEYEEHPAAQLFPLMSEDELKDLAADIKKNGLLEPVALYEDKVLDGRNRLRACAMAEVKPRCFDLNSKTSPVAYVISKNLHRRHLSTGQLGGIGRKAMPMIQEEAKKRQLSGLRKGSVPVKTKWSKRGEPNDINKTTGSSREFAAKLIGVSERTIQRAGEVEKADPEKLEQVIAGEVTLAEAHREVVRGENGKGKRRETLENAAKRRMIDGLSRTRGTCTVLAEMDVAMIRGACDANEVKTWATTSKELGNQLRKFGSMLLGGSQK